MKRMPIETNHGYESVDMENEYFFIEKISSALSIKNSQIQALTERNEFLEDLIAELAVQVYTTPPNV